MPGFWYILCDRKAGLIMQNLISFSSIRFDPSAPMALGFFYSNFHILLERAAQWELQNSVSTGNWEWATRDRYVRTAENGVASPSGSGGSGAGSA